MQKTSLIAVFLVLLLAGCQQTGGVQRKPLFDFSRAPRLFNFANNSNSTNSPWSINKNSPMSSWFRPNQQLAQNNQQTEMFQNFSSEAQQLSQQLSQFNSDNQQLLTEIGGLKQRLQAANDYNYQLKQQLTDSVAMLQQLQNEKLSLEQQVASLRMQSTNPNTLPAGSTGGIPSQLPGNATLRANNSLLQKISLVQLPGVQTRMDGDVIRVELPSDQLFNPGTYQINANYGQVLQQLGTAIRTHFPDQIIGIEAHWDNTQVQTQGPTPQTISSHQLTASQALAVFDFMNRMGMPDKQLFTMSMGYNRPRVASVASANGISPNRRVEVVIYPETWSR
ncbi:MAG: OmpA family protein [Pirellulaceae bacterium]